MVKNSPNFYKELQVQLEEFIQNLEEYNAKILHPRDKKDYIFLRDFFMRFFEDRNNRSLALASSDYQHVRIKALQQFASMTFWNLCMDGRVLAILINGASAKVGSSIRVPGGNIRDFVWGESGKLILLEDSNFAFILRRAMKKFHGKYFFEIFDSHIGCAARKVEELSRGKNPLDSGLLADVLYKKQMADAVNVFVKNEFGIKKKVISIQTSFNPHSGFMYMGLETENALSFAMSKGEDYTDDILQELVENTLIISSEQLVKNPRIAEAFQKHTFEITWKKNYVKSAQLFWMNIEKMKDEVLLLIHDYVQQIYPKLRSSREDAKNELVERSMILLTNAYSGFLHNTSDLKKINESVSEYTYPYGVHREEGVKVSEGGYPPYEISMFVVFSLDTTNLAANIELAGSLVRGNRREKRVEDRSGVYSSAEEFAEAPVPVVIQEIIREELSIDEWESLRSVSWKDLPKNWDTMSSYEFYSYLQSKINMSIAVANGINRLRERMAVLYYPQSPTSSHLIEHVKVALPIVASSDRTNQLLIPFVKLGFS